MSRLPSIVTHNGNIIDENALRNSLFDVHPIPEAVEIQNSFSQSRSNAGSPKNNPLRKSILKNHVYEGSLGELQSMNYPAINPNDTMKNRISTLEATAAVQGQANALTGQTFRNFGAHVNNVEFALRDMMLELQQSYETKLNNMKKEYDHRFELQASENKRLQSHVAQLKADSSALKKKLTQTSDRLRKLQLEFGDNVEEEVGILEEPSMFSSSGFSTRPNTIH